MVMLASEFERQRKLDLTAPLMSVRRHQSSAAAPPETPTTTTSSDEEERQAWGLEQRDGGWDSMRSPGAVPFLWERTPGRPKAVDSGGTSRRRAPPPPPPRLPPGRMPSPSREVEAPRRSSGGGGGGGLFRLPTFLLKQSAATPKSAPLSSFGEMLKQREAETAAAGRQEEEEEDEERRWKEEEENDDDAFSDAQQTENWEANDGERAEDHRRDFIMRRFLPAAKAIAAGEASSSSSPFCSPRKIECGSSMAAPAQHQPKQGIAIKLPQAPPSPHVSASVERIQAWQYKFSGGGRRRRRRRREDGDPSDADFFSMRACGFFSMGLLRRRLPSSRLRQSSDPSRNRYAAATNPEPSGDSSEGGDDAPAATPEAFYDCEASFASRIFSPQKPSVAARSNTVSSLVESRGFLGLPEAYRPPEDPYRNGGRSPYVYDKNGYIPRWRGDATTSDNLLSESRENESPNSRPKLGTRSQSPSRNGFGNQLQQKPTELSAAATASPMKVNRHQPLELAMHLESRAATINNDGPLLLPPKSPAHSWQWKAIPPPPPKWEAAVKSRQLRLDHLRYSEVGKIVLHLMTKISARGFVQENALQPSQY